MRPSIVCAVVVVALFACGCNSGDVGGDTLQSTSPGDQTGGGEVPDAVTRAVETFADAAGRPAEDFEIVSYEEADWPDSCLGLADPDEVCAQVIVRGWRIDLASDDGRYEVRADLTATTVRGRRVDGP